MSEPLRHLRRIQPPWESEDLTECGRPVSDVNVCDLREVVGAFVRKHGQQRAAFVYCMTCLTTANRYPGSWRETPCATTARWLEKSHWHEDDPRKLKILHALANLAAEHAEEFEALLSGEGTVSLADKRAAIAARRGKGVRL